MSTVVEIPTSPLTVEIAQIGVPGTNGVSGVGEGVLLTAAEDIGSSTFVNFNASGVRPAYSPSRLAWGFVRAAVTSGAQATVYSGGELNGLSGLAIGSVYYLGTSASSITATPPVSGFSQRVGVAIKVDTLLVDIGEPVVLT